ncbi:MAG: hypothetical protein P9M14_06875 [Candidatus Alcyoniella australis]|nr:hypothetical protein [Candidatus Alcyoniella australis]
MPDPTNPFEVLQKTQSAFAMAGSIASFIHTRSTGDDPGQVLLGGIPLPGLTQSVTIDQQHDIEGVPIEGSNGKVKLWHGLGDAEISIDQVLTTDESRGLLDILGDLATLDLGSVYSEFSGGSADAMTAHEKLRAIALLFQRVGPEGLVEVELQNEHVNAQLGDQVKVLFAGLGSADADDDTLSVSLRFVEFCPALVMVGIPASSDDATDSLDEEVAPQWT